MTVLNDGKGERMITLERSVVYLQIKYLAPELVFF